MERGKKVVVILDDEKDVAYHQGKLKVVDLKERNERRATRGAPVEGEIKGGRSEECVGSFLRAPRYHSPSFKNKDVGGASDSASAAEGEGESGSSVRSNTPPIAPRMKWTPELHTSFLRAVQMLGGKDCATPKLVLELMKVKGVTTTHIKSHLQMLRRKVDDDPLEDHLLNNPAIHPSPLVLDARRVAYPMDMNHQMPQPGASVHGGFFPPASFHMMYGMYNIPLAPPVLASAFGSQNSSASSTSNAAVPMQLLPLPVNGPGGCGGGNTQEHNQECACWMTCSACCKNIGSPESLVTHERSEPVQFEEPFQLMSDAQNAAMSVAAKRSAEKMNLELTMGDGAGAAPAMEERPNVKKLCNGAASSWLSLATSPS